MVAQIRRNWTGCDQFKTLRSFDLSNDQKTVYEFFQCKLCVARPSYSGRTSQAAERAPDSYNSSGETSADRTPLLPTAVFDSAQRYPTPELNYEISPIPPPRGLSHTFWSVQRWEIGLNKEGLHSAK